MCDVCHLRCVMCDGLGSGFRVLGLWRPPKALLQESSLPLRLPLFGASLVSAVFLMVSPFGSSFGCFALAFAPHPAIDVQIWDLAGQVFSTLSHTVHVPHRSLHLLLW